MIVRFTPRQDTMTRKHLYGTCSKSELPWTAFSFLSERGLSWLNPLCGQCCLKKTLMQIKLKYSVQERFQMLNNWVAWGFEYKYSPYIQCKVVTKIWFLTRSNIHYYQVCFSIKSCWIYIFQKQLVLPYKFPCVMNVAKIMSNIAGQG